MNDVDRFLEALKGANINLTVNNNNGDGQMYTGTVNNYYSGGAALTSKQCRICGKRLSTDWELENGMHGFCDADERHGRLGQQYQREHVQLPPMEHYSFPVNNTTEHEWQDSGLDDDLRNGKVRDW